LKTKNIHFKTADNSLINQKLRIIFNILYLLILISALTILAGPIFKEIHFSKISLNFKDYHNYEFFLNYHRKVQKDAVLISDKTINNIFQISYDQMDFPSIETCVDSLWNNSNLYVSNSHEFYSHSLTILWHLILAHEQTKEMKYLEKGREFILSWIKSNPRFDPRLMTYAWSDHSTAKRSISILFFMDYFRAYKEIDIEFRNETENYFNYALHFLSNSNNYSFPHNHGIYQDIALFFV